MSPPGQQNIPIDARVNSIRCVQPSDPNGFDFNQNVQTKIEQTKFRLITSNVNKIQAICHICPSAAAVAPFFPNFEWKTIVNEVGSSKNKQNEPNWIQPNC